MLNKKLLLRIYPYWLLLLVLCPQTNTAQSCVYFAYEPFDYSNGSSLNDYNGGAGWGTAWQVQNSSTNLPGYQINSNNPLAYENLPTIGNYMTGGEAYLTSGRRLNATTSGSFSALVADDQTGIGTQIGSELWVSFLLQKTQNNDNEVYIDLHNDGNISWCNLCASQNIAFGYLGIDHSDVNGEQRWTLKLNDDYYPSDLAVNLESAIFVVLHLTFDSAGTQVAVYIDPNNLGGNLPNNPNLTAVSSTTNTIQSLAAYMGSSPNNGAIDEIRFADSYACVAPDNNTSINLPPQAEISSSISFGQLPLSITFDGSSSTDPEGSSLSYLWDFGDGSPQQTGSNVSHTYTTYTGIISASLTVTDEVGLQNTSYHAITLLDENNTFSCLSSITCLNMASCGQNDGRIRINDIEGNSFSLIDAVSNLMPISNDNEYHNLAPGNYTLTVNGNNGCSDSKTLQISIDSTSCAGWQPPMCSMQIGTNLSSPIDWSPERPFKNLMKHSRPDPIVYTNDCFCWEIAELNQELSFDSNGYPTHIPQSTTQGMAVIRYFLSSAGAIMPVGEEFVLLYDGTGIIELEGVSNSNTSPGRISFASAGDGSVWLNLVESEASDPIHNIRIVRPQHEFDDLLSEPFYEGFIDKIDPFNTLRFMDWGNTNNNPISQWNNRTLPTYRTYATNTGVPYEIMIQLANTLQQDVWLCIPHAADNDYINQLATLFATELDPNLTIYLEYSNEVWNWIFEQAHYNLENGPDHLNYGRIYAERAKNTFVIWHNIFGLTEQHRVKRVLGIQATFTYLNEQILAHLSPNDWDYGSPTHYYGLNHESDGNPVLHPSSTPEDIINNSRNYWYDNIGYFKQDYDNIKIYGKEIITYEGGQHFVGNVFGIPYDYQQAMWDAQYEPEMYTLYDEVLDSIRSWGCRVAMNFSLASRQESIYGSWGVLNDIDTPLPYLDTAPKYQALLDNISNPCESSATSSLYLNAYLSGAFDNTSSLMRTDLHEHGLLPANQPYNTIPWNYDDMGNDSAINSSIFPSTIVDWVLIELRYADDLTSIAVQKAALLLNNGSIAQLSNGNTLTDGIHFSNLPDGAYHIIVRHRNHTDIISSSPINLSTSTSANYSFSSSINQAMGTDQQTLLSNELFGLRAGDITGDGLHTVSDFNVYTEQLSSSSINTYLSGDTDLDGQITVSDFNTYSLNASHIGLGIIRY